MLWPVATEADNNFIAILAKSEKGDFVLLNHLILNMKGQARWVKTWLNIEYNLLYNKRYINETIRSILFINTVHLA